MKRHAKNSEIYFLFSGYYLLYTFSLFLNPNNCSSLHLQD